MDNGMALSSSAQQAMVAHENGIPSAFTLSTQCAASNMKHNNGQVSVAEIDVHNQPTSYYNYYHPGYNGSFAQSNDGTNHSSMGVQGDHGSIAYYMPSYNPYASCAFVGADGHCVSQAYFTNPGYLQTPCYAWDLSYFGHPSNGTSVPHGASKSGPSPTNAGRSNGIKPSKLYGSAVDKLSTVSSNPKSRQLVAASNVSRPKFDTQPLKPLNQSGSYIQSAGFANVHRPVGNFQSLSYEKRGPFANNGTGYRSNARMWNGYDNLRSNRKSEFQMSTELTCGPRAHSTSSSNSSSEREALQLAVQKDKYNLADFKTEYETAKFYVIKSYSEDDVHKCIKYGVWSSTANGNKKVDAAFHDAEVKASETGTSCPIFLFFSVNGSGQFTGVAEMMGKVDFNKSMDFWQLDKWSGFFPIKWHIIKDVPNSQLRHILLENNENRPVTYTRDTQEIGLKQGLEMLKIFKNYLAKTSLLDDFEFYEDREKALHTRRSSKSGVHPTEIYTNGELSKQLGTEAKFEEELRNSQVASVSSLINLTKNLTLNSNPKVVSS